jgi:hypothetical protein
VTGTAGVLGLIPKDNSREHCLYLLALLNSAVTEFFVKKRSPKFAGGFYKFTAPYLKELPLPRLDTTHKEGREQLKKLTNFSATMISTQEKLSNAKSDSYRNTLGSTLRATEHRINELIFSMYGLSESDVSLISATTAPKQEQEKEPPLKAEQTLFQ